MREVIDTSGRLPRVLWMALLVVACVAAQLTPARGQPVEDSVAPAPRSAELPPIVVDGERETEPALVERSFETPDDATGFGETIFAEPTWRSFETTAELLGESVGAQIRRQGGRDDFATLSIRGAPAAQLRILLDGVALGRASDSVVNLADLPSDLIDRIEIYRGFSPVSLTPVSSAGVVNVITRDPDEATASAAAGGGSFGSAKVNAGGAGPLAGGSASAFASYRHTEGDFDFVDDNGSLSKTEDDVVRKRTNNDSDAVENLVRWRRGVAANAGLQLRNHLFYKEEGVPGLARFPNETRLKGRLETVREIAAAGLSGNDKRWSAEQIVTWEQKELSDYGAFDNTSETTASTTIARFGRPLGDSNWISGSADYTWEGFDQQAESPTLPSSVTEAERSSLALAVGDDWTVERLRTTVGMQLRHHRLWNDSNSTLAGNTDDHSTDPRLGLRIEPGAGVTLKSNVSTYFRPPNFDELYGTDGFTTGNPELRPETGLTWDAGFEWTGQHERAGRLTLGYSYFDSDIDDVIVVFLDFNRVAKAENATRARIRGHEARAEWKGPAGFAISANYTHQDAENRTGNEELFGKELAGIAPDEVWARLSWTRGIVAVAYDVEVTGAHFSDSENAHRLRTRTVHGVSAVIGPFWKGLRLTLQGDNLSDSLVPDEIGVPLPGRAFYATLSWSPAAPEAAN